MSTSRLAVMLTLAAASLSGRAHAHAPLARGVSVAPGGGIAVAVPGFGLITRESAERPFVYVCDALLGLLPSDVPASIVHLTDGALLMGSVGGVRSLSARSCPQESPDQTLSDAVIVALAAHATNTQVVYAVAAGARAGVWRSDDGGQTWRLRGPLSGAERVSALLVDALDPNTLTLSRTSPGGRATTLRSSDGGETFQSNEQDRALTLLFVPSGATGALWAVAPAVDQIGIRGFELLRADSLAGPWVARQRINYFGGFVVDAQGVLWLGDEGGGLYRSDDAGASFDNVAPDVPVACLTAASDALWACVPGTNTQPTLMRRVGSAQSLAPVTAFADVTSLVDCSPMLDVPTRCASAWVEWQRDVLMQSVDDGFDAGSSAPVESDAGATEADAARDAGLVSADAAPAPAAAGTTDRQGGGCAAHERSTTQGAWLPGLLLMLGLRRRRPRD